MKKKGKKLTKRVEESCVLYLDCILSIVDNVQFGVMNQINLKLICKWKMILYANQEGNIYTVLI